MKRSSTLFLRIVIALIALVALVLMIRFPQTEGRAQGLDLFSIYADPFILFMYVASIPFFVALNQAFKLLGYVDKNQVFSEASVKAVEKIKYCALIFIGFIVTSEIFVAINSKTSTDDGAGALMLGLVIIFATSAIATAAAVAQKLLQNAVDLKSENDLTV